MIQFQFADMREKAKWTKIKFDNELVSMNVDEGLNLGGHCENKLHDGTVCKVYNVLQVGMLSKSEKQEDVQKLRDVKKEAFNRITEEIPEERKFFEEELLGGRCWSCDQKLKIVFFKHAIFYNCKYEVKFVMKERGKRGTVTVLRKGIIAHENKIARF